MYATLRKNPGYTLIEIVIAVAVLAFLAAFTIPTYQLILAQLQLNSAVQETTDFIRLAEQKTVTEQVIYGVTLTTSATSIPRFLYNSSDGSKTTQTTLSLPQNISISQVNFSGQNDIRFSTSGAPNYSGNVVLYDNARGRSRRVEIRPSGAIISSAEF